MEPPRPLPEAAIPIFREGIYLTLSRWAALQIAVENEWGGTRSRDVPDQLCSQIFSWFTQSKEQLFIDDLENILDVAMDSLGTYVEDGSTEEVAEKLMIMHEECLEGNYSSIEKLREACAQRTERPSLVRQVLDENEESSDSDGEMMEADSSHMVVDAPMSQSTAAPTGMMPIDKPSTTEMADAEDGWTVVGSRKGKGRKK